MRPSSSTPRCRRLPIWSTRLSWWTTGSTDDSPRIVDRLEREHPGKVARHRYLHAVGKVGRESREFAENRQAERLSANYYNWSMRRCRCPFVLKWDGDMIANDAFRSSIAAWRESTWHLLVFHGVNVHPDRRHLAGARSTDPGIRHALGHGQAPAWVTRMERDYPEPRLFPRALSRYEMTKGWTQEFASPLLHLAVKPRAVFTIDEPCYLHMKFCKREPFTNYSGELGALIGQNLDVGPALRAEWRQVLGRWDLTS